MTLDPAIQEMTDRLAIRDVMARYARGLDRRDFDLVASCFTSDAYADYGTSSGQGVDKIVEITRAVLRFHHTTHFMGNQLVDLQGDTVNVETYAIDYLRFTKDGRDYDMWGGLRYEDTFVRQNGEWRIKHRVMHTDWRRYDPVTTAP